MLSSSSTSSSAYLEIVHRKRTLPLSRVSKGARVFRINGQRELNVPEFPGPRSRTHAPARSSGCRRRRLPSTLFRGGSPPPGAPNQSSGGWLQWSAIAGSACYNSPSHGAICPTARNSRIAQGANANLLLTTHRGVPSRGLESHGNCYTRKRREKQREIPVGFP